MNTMPKIGSMVRLTKEIASVPRRKVVEVSGHLKDVEGGVILRDRLEGFCCWNKLDLEPGGAAPQGSAGENK